VGESHHPHAGVVEHVHVGDVAIQRVQTWKIKMIIK
jgi:hypothetical protein